jgi:UDPglucose 6-dehydrogenase
MGHNVTVIGTGYVGLVTGSCLADLGHHVVCLDVDENRIARLEAGEIPIYEPGLDDIVSRNISAGRLEFTTDVEQATLHGDFHMIAVGTPQSSSGEADTSSVFAAARNIGAFINRPVTVIDKSTVPVGTGDLVRETIAAELLSRGVGLEFSVVSNPEFLKEGAAIDDFMHPDRIIVGARGGEGVDNMVSLYAPLLDTPERMLVTDVRSAELIKYAANAMLATRISFMNELSRLAEVLGSNIDDVRRGMGSDPRIGPMFLNAGVGYGGSCFPKDVQALIQTARSSGLPGLRVLEAVERVNDEQKVLLVDKLTAEFPDLAQLTIAVWGLAFKPNTDDVREATSAALIARLVEQSARVRAYDPVATDTFKKSHGISGIEYTSSAAEALDGADVLVILTEWAEFATFDTSIFATKLAKKMVFDGRNIYSLDDMASAGVTYHSIGRHTIG